jgi:choline dehydrogenase-like flavoprotein
MAPWYSHVEKFVGICGSNDGLESMPDGEYLPPFEFNCVEKDLSKKISKHYTDRRMIHGRWAQLTEARDVHIKQGRGRCQARDLCMRGCPFGGYFSSNSSTLPWAASTGNLTVRPYSVVHSVIFDEKKNKATGVRIIDSVSHEVTEYFARIIFMNASALNTNLVLLNSVSSRFPNGLGNDHDILGKYICHHNYLGTMNGRIEGYHDTYYYGRKPAESMMNNFRNFKKHDMDFVGGYMAFMGCYRTRGASTDGPEIGADYKKALSEAGDWGCYMYMQGETVPKESNRVYLSKDQKDQWGIPLLVTDVAYDRNDELLMKDFIEQGTETLTNGDVKDIVATNRGWAPGRDIHEMGGCRMGKDPKTSMLNNWNQLHQCKNVFVTDGACMASTGIQSPSILYMAFTARAANFAVNELKKQNL